MNEVTSLKVTTTKQQHRIEELESLLKSNDIPLPEERKYLCEHGAEIQQELENENEKELYSQAVHLKWSDPGVDGLKALIAEMNSMTYPNLEVLDLSGRTRSLLPFRHAYGRRGCEASLPGVFAELVSREHLPVLLLPFRDAASPYDHSLRQRYRSCGRVCVDQRLQVPSSSGASRSRDSSSVSLLVITRRSTSLEEGSEHLQRTPARLDTLRVDVHHSLRPRLARQLPRPAVRLCGLPDRESSRRVAQRLLEQWGVACV